MIDVSTNTAPCCIALNRPRWDDGLTRLLDANYRQLWDYAAASADRVGAKSEHVAVTNDGELIGLANVRIRTIPVLGSGIAYINGGPMVRRIDSPIDHAEALRMCLDALEDRYAKRNRLLLRIQPPPGDATWNARQRQVFREAGWRTSQSHSAGRTIMLSLEAGLESIRAGFSQKWRNCLNASERNSLKIVRGRGDDLFETFVHLHEELRERKGFEVNHDAKFYRQVQRELPEHERFEISLAYDGTQLHAGHMMSMLGDTAVYVLGATNAWGRSSKASYLLQWHAIEHAVRNGCRRYDLGGIDRAANPGVHRFKRGMGGEEFAMPGIFEYASHGVHRLVPCGAERVYSSWKGLRKSWSGASDRGP